MLKQRRRTGRQALVACFTLIMVMPCGATGAKERTSTVAPVPGAQEAAVGQGTASQLTATPEVAPVIPAAPVPVPAPAPAPVATATLDSIQRAIGDLKSASDKPVYLALIPAVATLAGVLFGGLITFFIQSGLAKRAATTAKQLADEKAEQDRELTRLKTSLDIGNSYAEWQLKQLTELYGPVRALLGQSNALYRQLNRALVKADPSTFRFSDEGVDFDNREFQIRDQGEWVRFRTVLHMSQVYGKYSTEFGVEDYFEEVVLIGGQLAAIIKENAGYARAEDEKLPYVFGKYLAHFVVMKRLFDGLSAKEDGSEGPKPIRPDASAVFPTEIQNIITVGFETLHKETTQWRTATPKAAK